MIARRAGLVLGWVSLAWAGVTSAHGAARIDLFDFLPREPDSWYTLHGPAYIQGKTHQAVYKFRVLNFDDFGREYSWRTSAELVAGPKRFSSTDETEIDYRGFRPVRVQVEVDKKQQVQLYDAWAATRPRFVEIGKPYPIGWHYGAVTVTGTEVFSVVSVTTDLGTFECLCLTGEYEKTVEAQKVSTSRQHSRQCYAREFGLVRVWNSSSYESGMMEFEGTVVATSRPPIFKPVVIAKP